MPVIRVRSRRCGPGRPKPGALTALAEAYRRWGFRAAWLDPLGLTAPEVVPELEPAPYGLTEADAEPLARAYCGTIGWEIGHVQDRDRRAWLARHAEQPWHLGDGGRRDALDLVARAELFERTLDRRLPGAKTFGLSGAEGFLVLLHGVIARAVKGGVRQVVIGGMHRGRMTQMALVFGKPLAAVIAEARARPRCRTAWARRIRPIISASSARSISPGARSASGSRRIPRICNRRARRDGPRARSLRASSAPARRWRCTPMPASRARG